MQNSVNQKNNTNHKHSRKNKIKYIPLALLLSLGMISCDKDDDIAPFINIKQSSLDLETGEVISPNDYFMVSDDEDPNPTIIVDINDKAIPYNQPHTFDQSGNFVMTCEARDISGNMSSAKMKVNVGSGLPQIIGLDNLQQNISPKIDQELNLLLGIKATDNKDGDITNNIKVFIKNINQQWDEIDNPTQYIVNYPGNIELKYQILDTDNNNIEKIVILDIAPKTQENITIPQMNIKPTDPAFTPSNIERGNKNRFEYLEQLKIYEIRAMEKVMIKNGLGNLNSEEYLEQLNNRQIIGYGTGPINSDDINGTYTDNDEYGNIHDSNVTHILCGKGNNGIGATGIIGPIIQEGINKIQRIKSNYGRKKFEGELDKTKKNIIFVVHDAKRNNLENIEDGEDISSIKKLINSGKCIILASSTNTITYGDTIKSKLRKEGYNDGDKNGIYSIPASITGVQCIGGCQDGFQVDIKQDYNQAGSSISRLVVGDKKDIRYSPAYHAFELDGKIYANTSGASSYSTPSFTGIAYHFAATNPSMTTDELLIKMNECKKDVPVNYYINEAQSYISKTADPSMAFAEIIATIPTEISLLSSEFIPITRNGYKFSIPHGDGIVKSDGTPLTQTEVDNISTRGHLAQADYFINPDELKKLGHKEGENITIQISVCSDGDNNYEQIWDKTYNIKLLP